MTCCTSIVRRLSFQANINLGRKPLKLRTKGNSQTHGYSGWCWAGRKCYVLNVVAGCALKWQNLISSSRCDPWIFLLLLLSCFFIFLFTRRWCFMVRFHRRCCTRLDRRWMLNWKGFFLRVFWITIFDIVGWRRPTCSNIWPFHNVYWWSGIFHSHLIIIGPLSGQVTECRVSNSVGVFVSFVVFVFFLKRTKVTLKHIDRG